MQDVNVYDLIAGKDVCKMWKDAICKAVEEEGTPIIPADKVFFWCCSSDEPIFWLYNHIRVLRNQEFAKEVTAKIASLYDGEECYYGGLEGGKEHFHASILSIKEFCFACTRRYIQEHPQESEAFLRATFLKHFGALETFT